MLDLIKPKLVYLDLPLFMALLSDLFPGVELPSAADDVLVTAIETELREHNLQVSAIQLCEHLIIICCMPSAADDVLVTAIETELREHNLQVLSVNVSCLCSCSGCPVLVV